MALTGFSVPTTLTDTRGQALPGRTLQVTGPNNYSATVVTDPATGVFRLGPLPVGDYTVSLTTGSTTRSAIVPVEATDASLQSEISAAISAQVTADVLAQAEAKISRTGASTGFIPVLQGDGRLALASPGGVSSIDTTAVHQTGAETVDGVKTFLQRPVVPDASFALSKLITTGTRSGSTVLFGDGVYKPVKGRTVTVTGSYTPTLDDIDGHIVVDAASACSLFLPSDSQVPFPNGTEFRVTWLGTGQPTFASTVIASGNPDVRVASGHVFDTAALSYSVPMPAGILDGDSVMVSFEMASTAAAVTWPTIPPGFVKVGVHIGPSGAGMQTFIATNVAAADYASGALKSFTHGHATNTRAVGTVVVFTNLHATSPIDGVAPAGASTTSTATAPTLVTVNPGVLEVSLKGSSTGTTAGTAAPVPPATITALAGAFNTAADQNNQIAIGRGALGGLAPGSTIGNRTWTKSDGTATYGPAMTIGVRPPTIATSTLLSAGNALKIAARYGDATATKMSTDVWLVTGYLAT